MKKLTICIPTYNRSRELVKNIIDINKMIERIDAKDKVDIIISDNNSDDYQLLLKGLKDYKNVIILKQKLNLGYEKNFIKVINAADTEWIMTLGDDDFISIDYLCKVLDYIENSQLTAIIPNYYSIDENGRQVSYPRDKCIPDKIYPKGSIQLMFKAHQLSGLTFKINENMIHHYHEKIPKNVYPQIFFLAYNLINGEVVHITESPLRNTVLKKKNFDYSMDSFINDFFIHINALNIGESEKNKLFDSILDNEYKTRVCHIHNYLHPFKILKKIKQYDLSEKYAKKAKYTFLKGYFALPHRALRKTINKMIRSTETL